jgi:hypothetical protein
MGSDASVVEAAYAAFGRGDIPAVLDLLDPAVEWSTPATLPQGGRFAGKDGVASFFQGIGAAWESLGLEVEAVGELADGLVVGVVRGSGPLRAGGTGSYGAVHLFTIQAGKIARFREYVDLDGPLSA